MDELKFSQLIEKYQQGLLSREEKFLLEEWFYEIESKQINTKWNDNDKNRLKDKIIQLIDTGKEHKTTGGSFVQPKTIEKQVVMKPLKRKSWSIRIAVAASIIAIMSISTWILIGEKFKPNLQTPIVQIQNNDDVLPGGNKAVLKFENGNSIILDSLPNGLLSHNGNTQIIKEKEGLLSYKHQNINNESVTYNTLSTPRGGQYQIVLPDGSKVWLNASSSIRFPTIFADTVRVVEITGEAYFEIAKAYSFENNYNKEDLIPFKVKVNDAEIQVLGTHFNVIAYTDEPNLRTTLLEGSVKVVKNNKSQLLKPGQQALMDKNNDILVVNSVNVEEEVAWKNGMFQFNNTDIETVMRQIARWYDVEIMYEGKIPDEHLTGIVSRDINLSKILEILKISGINFRIEEKKITVMQQQV